MVVIPLMCNHEPLNNLNLSVACHFISAMIVLLETDISSKGDGERRWGTMALDEDASVPFCTTIQDIKRWNHLATVKL